MTEKHTHTHTHNHNALSPLRWLFHHSKHLCSFVCVCAHECVITPAGKTHRNCLIFSGTIRRQCLLVSPSLLPFSRSPSATHSKANQHKNGRRVAPAGGRLGCFFLNTDLNISIICISQQNRMHHIIHTSYHLNVKRNTIYNNNQYINHFSIYAILPKLEKSYPSKMQKN